MRDAINSHYRALTKPQRSMLVIMSETTGWQYPPRLCDTRAHDANVCEALARKGCLERDLTREFVRYSVTPMGQAVADYIKAGAPRAIRGAQVDDWKPGPDHIQIVERACEMFGVDPAELATSKRNGEIYDVRMAAVAALHKLYPELSFRRLAICLHRDCHSTMVHALNRAMRKYDKEEWFKEVVDELCDTEILPLAPPPRVEMNCQKLEAYWRKREQEEKLRKEAWVRDDGVTFEQLAQARALSAKFLSRLQNERYEMHKVG